VTATADGDTTITFSHGLLNPAASSADVEVILTPGLQAPAALSAWAASWTATQITLTKATDAGSGNASAQLWVGAAVVHSFGG